MSTAATLSKAGKKVLVLEQNFLLGGGASTFQVDGINSEIGTYFLGEIEWSKGPSVPRTLYDQLTDGQLEFQSFDVVQDKIYLGKDNRKYEIHSGVEWKRGLERQFPLEHSAINKFFDLVEGADEWRYWVTSLKMLPLWISNFLCKSGLLNKLTSVFGPTYKGLNMQKMVEDLTHNKDLREVLAFRWNVGGVTPDDMPVTCGVSIDLHYTKHKSFWPVGGASEIPFNMIPVIERSGGKAFVRAKVEKILFEGKQATGIQVRDSKNRSHYIYAPNIVSSIGLIETTQLLPKHLLLKSELKNFVERVNTGLAFFHATFVLNGTKDALGLTSAASWHFEHMDLGRTAKQWLLQGLDQALSEELPTIAYGSNSAKDTTWERVDSHVGKSTINAMVPVSWDWFTPFQNVTREDPNGKYEAIKSAIGKKIWDKITDIDAKLKGRLIVSHFLTPLDQVDYLGKHKGGVYGMGADMARFDDPLFIASLRPMTDIPGLFLSGQDIGLIGVYANMLTGVMTAGSVLGRNTLVDLLELHEKIQGSDGVRRSEL